MKERVGDTQFEKKNAKNMQKRAKTCNKTCKNVQLK